MYLTIVV